MIDTQFFKSFRFNLFQSKGNYSRHIESCPLNFFRRIRSGKVRILSDYGDLQLRKGDYFFIPKGLKYRVYWSVEEDKIEFSSFGFTYFPMAGNTDFCPQKLVCTPEEVALFHEMEQDFSPNPTSIGNLYRFLGAVHPRMSVSRKSKSDTVLDGALAFMRANRGYTMEAVARHCGVSECSLFLKFRKYLGKTPVEVRHEILCEEATNLLATTDLSIEEISTRLGFSSSSYFRKIFKEVTGSTPTQVRKQQQLF